MKKILVLILCFNIVLAPTYAFASTSLGGWTITQQIAQGASTVLNASKTAIINGANVVKTSTAKITPNASQVAKVLRGGAAGYALSIAVQELLGTVDWVLDPANNQIVYKPQPTDPLDPRNQYYYQWYSTKYSSLDSLCLAIFKGNGWAGQNIPPLPNGYGCRLEGSYVFPYGPSGDFGDVGAYRVANPAYDPNVTVEDKKVSLDVIAAKVISNAESSTDQQKKVGSQAATTASAQDMLANDVSTQNDVETQLNTNSKTQTSEAASGTSTPSSTNPQVTNISLSFPVFCGWAPVVCEAAQTVIKFPQTITEWWNTATQAISASWLSFKEWLDWTKNDSELPDTETNQVTELPIPELQENAISWSASCPPDVQVPINLYGQSSTLTFSWSPWCQLLNVIKPAIIASSYIGAAFIVLGLRT